MPHFKAAEREDHHECEAGKLVAPNLKLARRDFVGGILQMRTFREAVTGVVNEEGSHFFCLSWARVGRRVWRLWLLRRELHSGSVWCCGVHDWFPRLR